MSNVDPSTAETVGGAKGEEGSVFAALPRSRPTVRSPRRAEALKLEPSADESTQGDLGLLAGREEEIEALARASLSLAGDVASLGLRAAGRAAAAVRNAVERS